MNKVLCLNLGLQFYRWYKEEKITIKFGENSRSAESDFTRLIELIDYVQEKHKRLESSI